MSLSVTIDIDPYEVLEQLHTSDLISELRSRFQRGDKDAVLPPEIAADAEAARQDAERMARFARLRRDPQTGRPVIE